MKQTKLILGLFAIALLGFFTACEDDPNTDPAPPVITLDGATGYIAGDAEVNAGSEFKIKVTATPNATSNAKLTNLSVVRTFNNVSTTAIDTALDKATSFSVEITLQAQDVVGAERIVITIEDKDGETAEKVLNITYVEAPSPLTSFTAVLLGAQTATQGSALDADLGQVYNKTDAATNSALIDIIYYYGSTNNATLTAPDDETIDGTGASSFDYAAGWATNNATRFNSNPGMTAAQFDAATDDTKLKDIETFSDSKIVQLAVDDVIAFKTAEGKKGLIKVVSIDGEGSGTITLDVKIL